MAREAGRRPHHPVVIIPGFISSGLELWEGLKCGSPWWPWRDEEGAASSPGERGEKYVAQRGLPTEDAAEWFKRESLLRVTLTHSARRLNAQLSGCCKPAGGISFLIVLYTSPSFTYLFRDAFLSAAEEAPE